MKKLFIILGLSFTLVLMNGCVRDKESGTGIEEPVKPSPNPDKNIDIDLGEVDHSEEAEEQEIDKTVKEEEIVYKNDSHGFDLKIPGWWKGSYSIEEEAWFDEVSTSVSFNFEDGEIYSNVFTIIIFDETIKKEDWDDPFLIYIGENSGKTYAYLQAMEPPLEVLEEENDKYLFAISKMVEEVPEIIETFRMENFYE